MLRGIADAQACFNQIDQEYFNYLGSERCSHDPNHLLEIRLADDANDPSSNGTARKVAEQLIQDPNVIGVIGHYSSGVTEATLPLYREARLPVISPSSTSSDLREPVFFRTVISSEIFADKIVGYIREQNIDRAIGLIDSSDDYSSNQWRDLQALFEANRISFERIELDDDARIEQEILNSSPNSAYVIVPPSTSTQGSGSDIESPEKVARIASQLLKQNKVVVGGSALYSSKTLARGQLFEGMVLPATWFARASGASQRYADEAAKKWGGQVNWATASSYDATQAFMSALLSIEGEFSTNELRQQLVRALESTDLPLNYTSGNPLKFEEHEPNREALLLKVVQGSNCSPEKSGYVFQLVPD